MTEAKLDAAYADVQKARALARVDQAVKDGLLTEKVADQMRERINAAEFPGFGAGGDGRLRRQVTDTASADLGSTGTGRATVARPGIPGASGVAPTILDGSPI